MPWREAGKTVLMLALSLLMTRRLSADSPPVLTALGNTNRNEAGEFLRTLPLGWAIGPALALPLFYLAIWQLGRPRAHGWRPAVCVPLLRIEPPPVHRRDDLLSAQFLADPRHA